MRHGILHGGGNVDDGFLLRRGFPHVQNRVAHVYRIVYFCSRETLRAVLEGKVAVRFICQLQKKLRAVDRDLLDLFFILPEYLLSLRHGCRIIKMDHRVRRSLDRLKGPLDDVLSGLRQHLYRHIIRDHVLLDQRPHKLILCLRSRRKSHFDLLKSDIYQHLEKLQLFFQAHGLDQRLIAVS